MNETPRKYSSRLEVVAESEKLVTFFCGYSLRTCTLYILWLDVICILAVFALIIVASSFIQIYVAVNLLREKNETTYTFEVNNEPVMYFAHPSIEGDARIQFPEIGKKLFEIIFCTAVVDLAINVVALIGVYYNNCRYVAPYCLILFNFVVWLALFLALDLLFVWWRFVEPYWWFISICFTILLQKCYKLLVTYSYYYHYSRRSTSSQVTTPQNLTTDTPVQLPTPPLSLKKRALSELEQNITSNIIPLNKTVSPFDETTDL